MKFNARLSKVVWSRTYLPRTRDAEGWFIASDGAGNIYVSGVQDDIAGHQGYYAADWGYLTMKYNAVGVLKWARTWFGYGKTLADNPSGMVRTTTGVYDGGYTWGKGSVLQAVLLKYHR